MSECCEYFILNLIYSFTYACLAFLLLSFSLSLSVLTPSLVCRLLHHAANEFCNRLCFINYICTYPHNTFSIRCRYIFPSFSWLDSSLMCWLFDPLCQLAVQYFNKCKCSEKSSDILFPFSLAANKLNSTLEHKKQSFTCSKSSGHIKKTG